jgi:HEAT repeat protein
MARHANVDPLSRINAPSEFADYSVQASLVAFLGRESPWQNLEAATLVLQQMIADSGPEGTRSRLEAARLLGQLHDGFEEELETLVRDSDPEVAGAAAASVGMIGGPQASRALESALDRTKLPVFAVVARAALCAPKG